MNCNVSKAELQHQLNGECFSRTQLNSEYFTRPSKWEIPRVSNRTLFEWHVVVRFHPCSLPSSHFSKHQTKNWRHHRVEARGLHSITINFNNGLRKIIGKYIWTNNISDVFKDVQDTFKVQMILFFIEEYNTDMILKECTALRHTLIGSEHPQVFSGNWLDLFWVSARSLHYYWGGTNWPSVTLIGR